MKKLLAILIIVFAASLTWAGEADSVLPVAECPKTTMISDCLKCHIVGNFKVQETLPDAHLAYPVKSMRLVAENNNSVGYFLLTDIDSVSIDEFFNYLWLHKINKAVIEIHSPGGALFDAQRIVGIFRYWQSKGMKIETRLFGAAFSAGFYVFVAGDVRLVDEYADLMWHEIQSFSGFGLKVETPSDREEAAKILRHLQDVRNAYLATRGKLSKAEIDKKVSKQEFWMSGTDAVKYGFADRFISGKVK